MVLLALGFGSGLAPKAPGTFGTLAALPLYFLMIYTLPTLYPWLVLGAAVAGVFICHQAAKRLGVHDHPAIVWDEFVGLWITLLWLPPHWGWLLVALLLFRLLDILKPWPISWLDRHLLGGVGIMADDIVAGLVALALLQTAASVMG